MYVNAEARLKSWFERLWQPESEGYSCTRAFRGRHYNWDSKHVTRFSVYARGSFPRSGSQTRTASEFSNYPGSSRVCSMLHLKNAWGSLWWDIWRCTFFEASGVGFMTEWDWDRCVFDLRRCWLSEDWCRRSSGAVKRTDGVSFPEVCIPSMVLFPLLVFPPFLLSLSLSQISSLDRWHIGLVLVVSI